jgi:hypothetical protein
MPGPEPKHPGTRARRNATSTKATLRAVPDMPRPELPEAPLGEWHPMTLAWWADIWSSPMAPEFDASDAHGLFALAMLTEDFWRSASPGERMKLAAEIRQQGQRYGLSPIDRRRLQWEIERTEEAQEKGAVRRASRPKRGASDPRSALTGA